MLFIQGGNCSTIAHTGDGKYVSSAEGEGAVYVLQMYLCLKYELSLENLLTDLKLKLHNLSRFSMFNEAIKAFDLILLL